MISAIKTLKKIFKKLLPLKPFIKKEDQKNRLTADSLAFMFSSNLAQKIRKHLD